MISIPLPRVELVAADLRRPGISHVIFDFDGTLSWLRHGWPRLLLDGFLTHAPVEWAADDRRKEQLLADILSLNGKPTIHQMERLCARAQETGHVTPSPHELLDRYLDTLRPTVQQRIASVRERQSSPDDFVVCGARGVLESLRDLGVTLIVLSGTVEEDVRAEAELLGLAEFFGRHIYGSPSRGSFSKKDVIDRILREERIEGRQLLAFGDGPVEIEFTKAVGGLAIGVASDEETNGSHQTDALKRDHLLRAGADAIIPDYVDADALLAVIFSK